MLPVNEDSRRGRELEFRWAKLSEKRGSERELVVLEPNSSGFTGCVQDCGRLRMAFLSPWKFIKVVVTEGFQVLVSNRKAPQADDSWHKTSFLPDFVA
jgi:hypothetical protein